MRFSWKNFCILISFTIFLCICLLVIVAGVENKKLDNTPQCGHWAILRCCQMLGVSINIQDLLNWLPPKKRGHSMYSVSKILEQIGLHTEGKRETYSELIATSDPVIAHMKPDHFVVVISGDDSHVYVFDGSGRRKILRANTFIEQWTNKTLRVWRNPQDDILPISRSKRINMAPCIQFDTLLIDKGEIPVVGDDVEFIFPFYNMGKSDLIIEDIRTDCRCMESTKPEKAIPSKGQGQITLKYKIKDGSGSFSHEALVQTNDPVVPIVKLIASGNTNRAVSIEPKVLNLGRLVCGVSKVTTCHVSYTGDIPLDILNIAYPSKKIDVKWRFLSIDDARENIPGIAKTVQFVKTNMRTLEISITVGPDYIGQIDETLYIYTNIENYKKIAIPLKAKAILPVVLSPEILFLGEVQKDKNIELRITAWSPIDIPFKITGIDTIDTGLETKYSNDMTNGIDIIFNGRIDDSKKIMRKEINISVKLLDSNKQLSIKLPIYATNLK